MLNKGKRRNSHPVKKNDVGKKKWRLERKTANCASCMESHSLRAGCIVSDLKSGPTKMVLKLKDLPITLNVTSKSALCEFVLIVMINEIDFFCPGLPAEIEKSTKHIMFSLFINSGYFIC